MSIIGLTRVRNESLIIEDTITHFLDHCDHIVLYDDCSTDDTIERALYTGGSKISILTGDEWRQDRTAEETRHRAKLLEYAGGFDWALYFDADERLASPLPENLDPRMSAYRLRLFDGYLTTERDEVYDVGNLSELPRMWGPEYRDIIMLFRPEYATFRGLDRREPHINGRVRSIPIYVKHFGKCLSVEHWDETCEYYIKYFPEPYRSKWTARRGKAIHVRSDFGRRLFTWENLMYNKNEWVKI